MNKVQNMNENMKDSNAAFVEELANFHSSFGTTLKVPIFNRQPLDLAKLWNAVCKIGGSNKVCQMKHWAQIGRVFGGTAADKNVSNNIKRAFTKWLLPYEREFYPEQAMPSSMEKAEANSSSERSRKRNRRRTCILQTTIDKKQRSGHSRQYEASNIKLEQLKSEGEGFQADPPKRSPAPLPYIHSLTLPYQRSYLSFAYTTEPKFCIFLLPSCNEAPPSGSPINTTLALQKCSPVNGLTNSHSNPPSEAHTQPGAQITKAATELYIAEEANKEMYFDLGQMQGTPRIKQETQGTMENQRNNFLNEKTPSEASAQQTLRFNTGISQPSIGFGPSFSGIASFLDSHVDRAKGGGELDRAIGNTITTKPKNN